MPHFTLSLCVGCVAGLIDVIPMFMQRLALRSCVSAFCTYLFATIIIFNSNLPLLPWWADGMGITLMMAVPVVLTFTGKERRAIVPVLVNALILGFLISVAERYIA